MVVQPALVRASRDAEASREERDRNEGGRGDVRATRGGRAEAERGIARAIEPYRLQLAILVYTSAMLAADALLSNLMAQLGIGAVTFLVLWLCTSRLPRYQRGQVWLCVVVATGFEVLGSILIGFYRYRFHNIPLYVPPGHGLVFLFGVTTAASPIVTRHARSFSLAVLGVCAAWSLAGLTVLPMLTGRLDAQGALCLPVFALFLLRSRRHAMFAAIFLMTTDVEIIGTLLGDWHWLATAPVNHLPSGNPPSAIAAGYCIIDSAAAVVTLALSRLPLIGAVMRGLTTPAVEDLGVAGS